MHKGHWIKVWVAIAFACVAIIAFAQPATPSPDTIAALQAQREALFDARGLDVPVVSSEILKAVRDGEALERAGQYRQALDRLLLLRRYAPFEDFPSFDVHMLSSWLYDNLGQHDLAALHRERAEAYRALLYTRLGSGATPDDPLHVVMLSEVAEWAKSRLSQISEVKSFPYRGHELMRVTYSGGLAGNAPRQLYMEVDRRTQAMANRAMQRFAPLAVDQMRPDMAAALEDARKKRREFIEDRGFDYLALLNLIDTQYKAAAQLDAQGRPQDALAALREIGKVRAVEDIPNPRLLTMYSALLGKTGDRDAQQKMRLFIFGVQQAMAHGGDAKSAASAIPVILINEEYDVAADRGLKLVQQSLVQQGDRAFDVLKVKSENGDESELWFDVTQLFQREHDSLAGRAGNKGN
jgi:hypothetical protein